MKAIKVYEKFTEGGDPVRGLNVGGIDTRAQFNEYATEFRNRWKTYINDTFVGRTIKGKFVKSGQSVPVSDYKTYIFEVKEVRFHFHIEPDKQLTDMNELTTSPIIVFTDTNDEVYYHSGSTKIFILE